MTNRTQLSKLNLKELRRRQQHDANLEVSFAENIMQRHQLVLAQSVLLQQQGRARREPSALPKAVLGHVKLFRPRLVGLSVNEQETLHSVVRPVLLFVVICLVEFGSL